MDVVVLTRGMFIFINGRAALNPNDIINLEYNPETNRTNVYFSDVQLFSKFSLGHLAMHPDFSDLTFGYKWVDEGKTHIVTILSFRNDHTIIGGTVHERQTT
jgi:hypothetical protein